MPSSSCFQKQLETHLQTEREIVAHPGAKGAMAEANWKAILDDHLPSRYEVSKAFVIDSCGGLSEEIDLVIHDRQYSPLLFNRDGALYIPAESVYAILEVKQELDKGAVAYAGEKAASVRALKRTSAPVPHAGGVFEPRTPSEILAGIVALESSWKPPFGDSLLDLLRRSTRETRLELLCALRHGACDVQYVDDGTVRSSCQCAGHRSRLLFPPAARTPSGPRDGAGDRSDSLRQEPPELGSAASLPVIIRNAGIRTRLESPSSSAPAWVASPTWSAW